MAAAGIVSTHAVAMLPATPHSTADSRRVAPTPITDDVMMCVVDTGRPYDAVANSTPDATVWDAKPAAGSILMTLRPKVRMIRQPPEYVPSEIAVAAERITHSGIGSSAPR